MAEKLMIPDTHGNKYGEVRISNDVIAVIAGMAVCDEPGLYIDGKTPGEFIDRSNAKNISRAIKIEVVEGAVVATLTIAVEYGVNITALCNSVQEKVKQAVQTMTNLTVARVDISVQELLFRKDKGEQKK